MFFGIKATELKIELTHKRGHLKNFDFLFDVP